MGVIRAAIEFVTKPVFDLQGADWNQEIFPIIRALRSLLIRQGVPLAGAD